MVMGVGGYPYAQIAHIFFLIHPIFIVESGFIILSLLSIVLNVHPRVQLVYLGGQQEKLLPLGHRRDLVGGI